MQRNRPRPPRTRTPMRVLATTSITRRGTDSRHPIAASVRDTPACKRSCLVHVTSYPCVCSLRVQEKVDHACYQHYDPTYISSRQDRLTARQHLCSNMHMKIVRRVVAWPCWRAGCGGRRCPDRVEEISGIYILNDLARGD